MVKEKEEKEKEKAKMEKGKREKAKEARERKLELATLAKELDTSQQTVGQPNGQNLKGKAKVNQKTGASPGDLNLEVTTARTEMASQQGENRHLDNMTGLNANLPNQAHALTPNVPTGTLESAMHGNLEAVPWGTSANSYM